MSTSEPHPPAANRRAGSLEYAALCLSVVALLLLLAAVAALVYIQKYGSACSQPREFIVYGAALLLHYLVPACIPCGIAAGILGVIVLGRKERRRFYGLVAVMTGGVMLLLLAVLCLYYVPGLWRLV